MNTMSSLFALIAWALISTVRADAPIQFLPNQEINSGVPWYDTTGKLINCHGAGIINVAGVYYMIGEKRTNDAFVIRDDQETHFSGCTLYSSKDLINWKYEGDPIVPIDQTEISSQEVVERPKIIYNEANQEFLIYMHTWDGKGSVCFATSPAITGPYKYQGLLKSDKGEPVKGADMGLFVDSDKTAYLLETNGDIYQLSPDYKSVSSVQLPRPITIGYTESPALFKVDNTYFYLCSTMQWWHADDNYYATATSMKGPWTNQGFFAPEGSHTWNSQTTFVLPVTGSKTTTYIYMGDRWCDGNWLSGTDVWQPFKIDGTKLSLPSYIPSWRLDVGTGEWQEAVDDGVSINDNDRGDGENQIIYSGSWTHIDERTGDNDYQADATYSDTANDSATIQFKGSQIRLYGVVDSQHGILGITLSGSDGTPLLPETTITQYSNATRKGNYLNYVSPLLPKGSYQLKIRITGDKEHYSSSNYGVIDRITVK